MKKAFIFVSGAVVGGLITWILTKEYYKEKADKEIKEIADRFAKKETKSKTVAEAYEELNERQKEAFFETYGDFVDEYSGEQGIEEESIAPSDGYSDEPHVISPQQFVNEKREYEKLTYTYFRNDDVLIDEYGEEVYPSDTIGIKSLDRIGEFEDDVVYVRSDKDAADYEVIRVDIRYESRVHDSTFDPLGDLYD